MLPDRAIILAAGSSSRMGTQKLLLPFGETTIIETVIQNVLESRIESAMVVLGADRERVSKTIGPLPVKRCYNKAFASGMLSSIICGFMALPADTGAVLVFLGDQPRITPEITNHIITAYHESRQGIVVPVINQRRGHPLLVDFKYRPQILKLDPDKGLRSLMRLFPEDLLEVDTNEPGILLDIDTRKDYNNTIQKTK